jgi:hypothetical protein
MKTPLHLSYTNRIPPEFLLNFYQSPFTEQQLAGFTEQSLSRNQ